MLTRNGAATALEDTQPDQQTFQTIDPPAPTETAAVPEASAVQSLGTSMSRGVHNGAKARKTPPGMPFSSDNYQPRKWTVKPAAVSRAQDATTQPAMDDALPLKDAEYSEEVGETPDPEREATDFFQCSAPHQSSHVCHPPAGGAAAFAGRFIFRGISRPGIRDARAWRIR